MKSSFFSKLALAAISTLIPLMLVAGGYELYKRREYQQWREDFGTTGWQGKITKPSPNPDLIWEYRPYGRTDYLVLNRYGFRDNDYPTPKRPENVYRIAFAGDSVTLGLLVLGDNDVYVRQYERIINSTPRAKPVQALNFSVDGYNALQVMEMIRTKVLPFEPDHVVYTMCLNDFDFETSSGFKMLYFRPPASFLLKELRTIRRRLLHTEFHRETFEKNHETVFRSIEKTNALLAEKGIRFTVAILPIFPFPPNGTGQFDDYPIHDVHLKLHRFFREKKIPFADLFPQFNLYEGAPLKRLAFDVWHPTPWGHRILADGLVPLLKLD